MHNSVQINLSLLVLIQNDSRMYPGRVATLHCGKCSFPCGTKNNPNAQFLVFLLYSINPNQLFAAATQLKT